MSDRTRVGVFFGSRSVEHDVSIITARQTLAALDRSKYEVIPVYIDELGGWWTGSALADAALPDFKGKVASLPGISRVTLGGDSANGELISREKLGLFGRSKALPSLDVAFPCIHGTYGEDGTIQGLFELANLPYVGAGVVGSAVGMDKILMKAVFQTAGIPVCRYLWFTKSRWLEDPERVLDKIEHGLGYPAFVKPANLGSSIGINRANDRNELEYALEVASKYDRRLVVEEALEDIVEVNCSVLGNDQPAPSVCEQPSRWQDFLTFEDKYIAGGKSKGMGSQQRLIPAPIGDELTREVQRLAVESFKAIDCAGIARVDTMVRQSDGKVWLNEINTLPGSLSFYLWEASGLPFSALCDRLIELAFERHAEKKERVTSYDNALLRSAGGAKVASR